MFLTGSFAGLASGLGGTDPEKERDPPAEPTPINFPYYPPYKGREWSTSASVPDFQVLFAKILKPTDISDEHVHALNIAILPTCPVEDLLPPPPTGTSYLPPPAPGGIPNEDPAVTRKRKDFEDRLTELRVDNDLAFRTITRSVAQGVRPPRLAHMRKFWEGLEHMSQFWDCSLDRYYETAEPIEDDTKSIKRQRLESGPTSSGDGYRVKATAAERTWPLPTYEATETPGKESKLEAEPIPANESGASTMIDSKKPGFVAESAASVSNTPRMRYKGRRTATGRDMPDQYRAETLRAFVEGTIWPFRTSSAAPRVMPIVQFGKLNLPVRQTAAVYRIPNDRLKARQGWLAGPILGVQVRPETDFIVEDATETKTKARLDLMREVGGMLQLAQERRRDSRPEVKPGEGKWWTTKPRWGGGPGGEVQNDVGNSDVVALVQEVSEATKENNDKRERDGQKHRKRKSPAILWKELKCGRGYWDPRIEYTAIGKAMESEYDEIFMLSSINHHFSIVKLTIHGDYVDCLTSGTVKHPLPEDPDWCRPRLQRTQWFDLFDMEQRVTAFKGLWGLMTYLTRHEPS